ncbi:MAG: aminoglycoside phosphotransferase family protein [Clostridia bacterium]|nr:aminoglycoside phosphotransferase family protein [Clostridia bacterium]
MKTEEIKNVAEKFGLPGKFASCEEITAGNINTTYKIVFKDGSGNEHIYVLQRINTVAFKDPVGLMNNVRLVTSYIEQALKSKGVEDTRRRVLHFIPSIYGDILYEENGNYWRVAHFIDNAIAYDLITDPRQLYEAGRGFGEFQRLLSDFPAEKLTETIPDFHNTKKRFEAFEKSVKDDPAGRVSSVREEIEFLMERKEKMGRIVELIENGTIPLRVTHNDTKLNNVMLDKDTGKAVCVIDLDTVMPGTVLYDYGDAIRYGANTAAEDEEDVSLVGLDMNLFRLFTDGFVSETSSVLTEQEIRYLPFGAYVMTAELVLRFLKDYIDGDVYFRIKRPGHNLIRTRAQKKLLESIELHYDEMCGYVQDLIANNN